MSPVIDFELITLIFKTVFNPAVEKLVKEFVSKEITPVSYKASLEGDGAIAQGEGATATGAGGIYISGNLDKIDEIFVGLNSYSKNEDGKQAQDKNYHVEKTFQKIAETSQFVTKQLEASYSQAREQAYAWFRFSIIAAGIGLLLIVVGVIVLMLGQTTEGIITAITSIIPNVIAALFFVQSKAANERVDVIQVKLSESREIHTAVEIANSIETKKERDKLKAEIIRKVIGLSTTS